MSIDSWLRVTTAVRTRLREGFLAQYGAGLHSECDDCATAPADVVVPMPRPRSTGTVDTVDTVAPGARP